MGGIELIQHSRAAGLKIHADAGNLTIRGPQSLSGLAQQLIGRKSDVLAALALPAGPGRAFDAATTGAGATTPRIRGYNEVSAPAARVEQQSPPPIACGSLHIQPQQWVHRDGRAYCPGCDRFMGYVRGRQP